MPEIGGPLYIRANFMILKSCSFIDNNGNLGGAIYLAKYQNLISEQTALMEDLIFQNNTGGQSGCIEFSSDLENFSGIMRFLYFLQNRAGCICRLY